MLQKVIAPQLRGLVDPTGEGCGGQPQKLGMADVDSIPRQHLRGGYGEIPVPVVLFCCLARCAGTEQDVALGAFVEYSRLLPAELRFVKLLHLLCGDHEARAAPCGLARIAPSGSEHPVACAGVAAVNKVSKIHPGGKAGGDGGDVVIKDASGLIEINRDEGFIQSVALVLCGFVAIMVG